MKVTVVIGNRRDEFYRWCRLNEIRIKGNKGHFDKEGNKYVFTNRFNNVRGLEYHAVDTCHVSYSSKLMELYVKVRERIVEYKNGAPKTPENTPDVQDTTEN